MKRGNFFFSRASAEANAELEEADGSATDASTIAAGEPVTPRPSKSEERLQRVRRLQMAQFMDQLRRTSLQQVSPRPAALTPTACGGWTLGIVACDLARHSRCCRIQRSNQPESLQLRCTPVLLFAFTLTVLFSATPTGL